MTEAFIRRWPESMLATAIACLVTDLDRAPLRRRSGIGGTASLRSGALPRDEVVFAQPGDMILLGARSLEGLNLRVDSRAKQLVDAGPIVAAVA